MSSQPTLYYTPTSCGAASFLAQQIAGLNLNTLEVDLATHKLKKDGSDFYAVNPKGNVPALAGLPNGVVLNEGAAVLQWIADQAPASRLAPAAGTVERYELINTFNFIATDLHAAGFGPLFNPALADSSKAQKEKLASKLKYVDQVLLKGGKKFVVGDHLTIADLYLVVVLSWAGYLQIDLSPYGNIGSYVQGINALPEIVKAREVLANATKA